jgi:hypothetical protein
VGGWRPRERSGRCGGGTAWGPRSGGYPTVLRCDLVRADAAMWPSRDDRECPPGRPRTHRSRLHTAGALPPGAPCLRDREIGVQPPAIARSGPPVIARSVATKQSRRPELEGVGTAPQVPPRHCEERSDEAIQSCERERGGARSVRLLRSLGAPSSMALGHAAPSGPRHCEERSDEAIQSRERGRGGARSARLLRRSLRVLLAMTGQSVPAHSRNRATLSHMLIPS